jgi:hypothetical protein
MLSLLPGDKAHSPNVTMYGILFCNRRQLVVISRQACDPALPAEQRRQLQDEQLKPLQQLVTEAAAQHYAAAGARLRQKQLDLSTSLGSCPPEISAAIAFKVRGVLSMCFVGRGLSQGKGGFRD